MKSLLKKRKRGFTLVEILVVIVIIGLLFMVFVPKIDFASNAARETGVKSDFRAFSLASEQLMRENAGLGKSETLAKVTTSLNQYLDPSLQLTATGVSSQNDPWNKAYTVQIVGASAGSNNGGLIFLSGGKDGSLDGNNDYAIATVFINGSISTATTGFTANISSSAITGITVDGVASAFTLTGNSVALKYKK